MTAWKNASEKSSLRQASGLAGHESSTSCVRSLNVRATLACGQMSTSIGRVVRLGATAAAVMRRGEGMLMGGSVRECMQEAGWELGHAP